MSTTRTRRPGLATLGAAVAALALTLTGAIILPFGPGNGHNSGPRPHGHHRRRQGPRRCGGRGYAFRGLPYAAPPTGDLRWKPPQPPATWTGVRDATQFAPSPIQPAPTPFTPAGPQSEDSLYLNVSTPQPGSRPTSGRPVLVWFHGGGMTLGGGRYYDPTKLAADGLVVVTVNYRLGVFGFLSHPALATKPGGPSGNYGLMDQQAALRWVRDNIGQFGGDPARVTIAGQSSGGLNVLAHLVSAGSRGLFHRAIVQSGAFALTQQSLAQAEAAGVAFADSLEGGDQSAAFLRHAPAAELVGKFPFFAIPGVVDGKVLTESVGSALEHGRFARVPILNGSNHDEEATFVASQLAVSGGSFVQVGQVTPENYREKIASTLGCSRRSGGGDRRRVPPRRIRLTDRRVQRTRRGRQLRGHGIPAGQVGGHASADVRLRVQRRRGAHPVPTGTQAVGGHARVRARLSVRPAGRPRPGTVQPPAGETGRHHAVGVVQLRSQRQPVVGGAAVAGLQQRPAGDVPADTTASGRHRVRCQAPRVVLVGRLSAGRTDGTPTEPGIDRRSAPGIGVTW